MKIATFNVNNVNRRLSNLLRWLETSAPDIACLQELKCTDEDFPEAAIRSAGYAPVWRGQRTWNGVAILSRVGEPIITRTTLPGDTSDKQARYIEAAVNGTSLAASTCRTAIRNPAQNLITSSNGSNGFARMRANC